MHRLRLLRLCLPGKGYNQDLKVEHVQKDVFVEEIQSKNIWDSVLVFVVIIYTEKGKIL